LSAGLISNSKSLSMHSLSDSSLLNICNSYFPFTSEAFCWATAAYWSFASSGANLAFSYKHLLNSKLASTVFFKSLSSLIDYKRSCDLIFSSWPWQRLKTDWHTLPASVIVKGLSTINCSVITLIVKITSSLNR